MRRTRRARIDDHRLAYEVLGDGEPHLLFHWGLLGDRNEFLPLAERLREWGTRILLDGRGHGKSDAPRQPYTLEEYADGLARFVRQAVAGPAVLIGHGMAATVFLRLALRHEHLVAGLVLASPPAEAGGPDRDPVAARILDAVEPQGLTDETLDALARMLFGDAAVTEAPEMIAGWRKRMARLDPEELTASARAVVERSDISDRLAAIAVPTLLLVGTEDAATSAASATSLGERLGGSVEQVELPGGHAAPSQHPQETAEAVRAFLDGLGLRPGGP